MKRHLRGGWHVPLTIAKVGDSVLSMRSLGVTSPFLCVSDCIAAAFRNEHSSQPFFAQTTTFIELVFLAEISSQTAMFWDFFILAGEADSEEPLVMLSSRCAAAEVLFDRRTGESDGIADESVKILSVAQ